jgi:hypothetical protein
LLPLLQRVIGGLGRIEPVLSNKVGTLQRNLRPFNSARKNILPSAMAASPLRYSGL